MKKTGADRNAVARLLGMTRRTLAYRIALYGLDVELAALPT
jgi:DNA-binding NtrC family response regulator